MVLASLECVEDNKSKNGSLPVIEVDYIAPPVELSPYVSAYYLFKTDEAEMEDLERADIAQFRIILEGEGEIEFGDGNRQAMLPVSIMGPRTKASRVHVKGPARLFGVGLLPAGWAAFTRLPADKHVNRILDGVEIFGERVLETANKLKSMTVLAEMAELMNKGAPHFAESAQSVPHWFIRVVDQWLEARLSPEIGDLESATNLSRRQIERLCRQLYGSPPKLLVRKYRALRTASAIASGKGDWQDFIDEAYYDQPHCIREIKEFIGITPSAVRQHASRLTSKTFDRSQMFGDISVLSATT
jgi:AraC-like DNA-binding protein